MDETHWCGFWRKLLSCCLWFLWGVLEVGKVSVVSIILSQFACWTGSSLWWCGWSAYSWSLYVIIRNFCFADVIVTRSAVCTVNVQDDWFMSLSGLTLLWHTGLWSIAKHLALPSYLYLIESLILKNYFLFIIDFEFYTILSFISKWWHQKTTIHNSKVEYLFLRLACNRSLTTFRPFFFHW